MEKEEAPKARGISCPICSLDFYKPYNMRRHLLAIHGYTYDEYIQNNSNYKQTFSNDIQINSNDIQSSSNDIQTNSNDKIQHNNIPYKCLKCSKGFCAKWYLTKHMEKCKGIKDRFSCEYCNSLFSHEKSRFGHYKICKAKNKKEENINTNEIIEEINVIEEIPNTTIGSIKKKKQAISATIKRLVWNTHIGEEIGKTKCLCCKITDITQLSFNCGYIIAEANNGNIIVSNLKPICQNCNSSMGTKNMDEFMKTLI
uniref:C2H2-type domain-containing protein n=1 Tax=viral metagenome TaxID=1070528 RepID=A0A6C0CTT0_9ZZZZ